MWGMCEINEQMEYRQQEPLLILALISSRAIMNHSKARRGFRKAEILCPVIVVANIKELIFAIH